jgi:predicted nucleic acid-binding protein
VERVPRYADAVDARLSGQDVVRVASELTRLECRVKPLREANAAVRRDFDEYFAEAVEEVVALTRAVMDRATAIRAQLDFKVRDAIHLAAAIESDCDPMLTNDQRLKRFTGLAIEVVRP